MRRFLSLVLALCVVLGGPGLAGAAEAVGKGREAPAGAVLPIPALSIPVPGAVVLSPGTLGIEPRSGFGLAEGPGQAFARPGDKTTAPATGNGAAPVGPGAARSRPGAIAAAAGRAQDRPEPAAGAQFDGTRPLRLLIMGAPASGKGTLAKRVAAEYGLVHVAAGDLLREKAAADPELSEIMERGELVPVETVVGLVRERLSAPDARARGFILDGFPRRLAEARAFKDFMAAEGLGLDAAIRLSVPEAELLRRMRARGRPDDTEETFTRRLEVYRRETMPAMRAAAKGNTVLTPRYKGLDKEANFLELKRLLDALLRGDLPPRGLLGRFKSLLPPGGPGARKLALLLAGWNFLTIATYYILAPVRGAFLLHNFGPSILPWVYMAGAAVTGLAVWGYSRFSRLPRRVLIGSLLVGFTGLLGGWWLVGLAASQVGWVSFVYYLFGDLFSIMSVTLLWTYANDRFGPETAKSYFGAVAAAGPLGAIVGSLLTKVLVAATGALPLLLAAAAVYAGTIPLFLAAERVRYEKEGSPAPEASAARGAGMLGAILKSPFLSFLTLVVLFERLVPDFGNYIFNAAAFAAFPEKEGLISFGASYGLWQNVGSLAASLLLTSWILKRLGVGKALMGTPLSLVVGLLAFAASPTLGAAVAFNAIEGLQRYTWFKAAKEATYTVGSKDVIYRFKAFIEMFVYRFARGLAGFLLLMLTSASFLHWGPAAVALAGVPLALLWAYAAWRVGREFKKAETAQ